MARQLEVGRMTGKRWAVLLLVVLTVPYSGTALAATFMGLGDLPGGVYFSRAEGVSTDGRTVVGQSVSDAGSVAFRWALAGGMTEIDGQSSCAYDISANGTVVGYTSVSGHPRAAVLDGPGSVSAGGNWSTAYDVSADGSVIVGDKGWVPSIPQTFYGFRNGTGLTGITYGWEAHAYAVSGDGQVVVGVSYTGANNKTWDEATVWTGDWAVTGMIGRGLGRLGNSSSSALAISSDGSTIVGESGNQAVLFSPGPVISLGYLPGKYSSSAKAVSGDGSIITGSSGGLAFIWDQVDGMQSLQGVLEAQYGVDLTGWTLSSAEGISDDGKVIVGYGTNPYGAVEGWYAELSSPAVPEPASLTLWSGLGVMGLIAARRKRRQPACKRS